MIYAHRNERLQTLIKFINEEEVTLIVSNTVLHMIEIEIERNKDLIFENKY